MERICRHYQCRKVDRPNLTSNRLTTETARKKLLLVGDASGSTIGSMDGGRTLLVTTRHGQTHRSGFLGVDTETGETRLLREEDKRYGNIFNPPFLPPDGRTRSDTRRVGKECVSKCRYRW